MVHVNLKLKLKSYYSISGSKFNEHVFGAAGLVLDARAGRAAAVERDGGHEPADDRRTKYGQRQQTKEEGVRSSKPEEDV